MPMHKVNIERQVTSVNSNPQIIQTHFISPWLFEFRGSTVFQLFVSMYRTMRPDQLQGIEN